MNKEQREIPNDDDNPFVTIGDLINQQTSVAALATAIEQEGIFTWDKYGRWGKANDSDKDRALELLEMHYEWEITPPEEKSHDELQSPMEEWGCVWDNAYHHFGWATKVLPDFTNIQRTQVESPPRRVATIKRKTPDVFAIALTKFLVEIAKRDPTLDISAMPGIKKDLYELAQKWDADLKHEQSTFDTYIKPFCQFKKGARQSSYYRDLFKDVFK